MTIWGRFLSFRADGIEILGENIILKVFINAMTIIILKGEIAMKKSIACLLICCIMFLGSVPNVVLANETEETLSVAELQDVLEVMNEMNNGDEVVVANKWVVACESYVLEEQARSVYKDTKSEAKQFTVTRLGSTKLAFTFKQTVTYIVNDEAETITIVDYDIDYTVYLNDFEISVYKDKIINNELSHYMAVASGTYEVYSWIEGGSFLLYMDVVVYRTGIAEFTIEVIQ